MSAPELPELPQDERLHLEIDMRLQELWAALTSDLDGDEDVPLEQAMAAARYAYARGYYDAMIDGEDTLGPSAGYPKWAPPVKPERIDLS